mmetsp:Transcript_159754/g.508512  ORF Transcript_159754/g.508512 Transcript_159754/m.508512 type:complete len:479 (+) Transcript_159754:50-1486(+)
MAIRVSRSYVCGMLLVGSFGLLACVLPCLQGRDIVAPSEPIREVRPALIGSAGVGASVAPLWAPMLAGDSPPSNQSTETTTIAAAAVVGGSGLPEVVPPPPVPSQAEGARAPDVGRSPPLPPRGAEAQAMVPTVVTQPVELNVAAVVVADAEGSLAAAAAVAAPAADAAAAPVAPHGVPAGWRPPTGKVGQTSSPELDLKMIKAKRGPLHGFVLLATQRSGTHFLDEALGLHPCISMCREVFLHDEDGFWTVQRRKRMLQLIFRKHLRPQDAEDSNIFSNSPKEFKHALEQCNKTSQERLFGIRGFDWKLNQGVEEDWATWFLKFCKERDLKLLWYLRRNVLRQHLSRVEMKRTGLANTQREKKGFREKATLDIGGLLEALQRYSDLNSQMDRRLQDARAIGVKVMKVFYEDLFSKPEQLDKVVAFLSQDVYCNAKAVNLTNNLHSKKMHAGSLHELIENYDEVKRKLIGTKFSKLLE